MRLPRDLLERGPEEASRLLALAYLTEAMGSLKRLTDATDPEALHDFRVAVRRLRSCCRAYRPFIAGSVSKKLRGRLREITTATNAARDAEVLLAWVRTQRETLAGAEPQGVDWLVERLEERRAAAQAAISGGIPEQFSGLAARLRKRLNRFETTVHLDGRSRPRPFGRVAGELIQSHVAELREQLKLVHAPGDADEAHRARISAKRLRYLLEPLARRSRRAKGLVTRLKALQDLLGDLRDMQVLAREIAAAVEWGAAERARRQHQLAMEDAGAQRSAGGEPAADRPDLVALARLAEARQGELFAAFETDWLRGGERFLRRVERFGKSLAARRQPHVEIERKFLLTGLPERAKGLPALEVAQGWIPGAVLQERLRRTCGPGEERFTRTIKLGAGKTRTELEEPTTREVFESLWPLTEGRRVFKRRYPVADKDLVWEIDEFTDRDLTLAEVELSGEDEASEPPDWLRPYVAREVTGEPEYLNVNLAR